MGAPTTSDCNQDAARAHGSSLQRLVRHLVMFSGGVCSWAAAKRVVERHGKEGVVLLFADTKMEDEDLYRFLDEAAANVGVPLVKIADGRNPWELMNDVRLIGNSGKDPCSAKLKRDILNDWRKENCDLENTVTHFGLLWDEEHRLINVQKRHAPWKCAAPMCEKPLLSKDMMLKWLKEQGIAAPRLYGMGFPHNNCGGFCVKAGQGHFAHLLRMMPERYAWHEAQEEALREKVGDHSIMRDRSGGKTTPLTMKQLRERIQSQGQFDAYEWGGCGCAVE